MKEIGGRAIPIAGLGLHDLVRVLLIVGIAALVCIAYSQSIERIVALWQYSAYRYGVLVFPISAYLLWRNRTRLGASRLEPWPLGLVPLAALVLIWLVSRAIGIQLAEHLAVILLIPAAVATFLGISLLRSALFPLLFLVAAVPMGDELIPYLMRITADIAAFSLRLVGLPVFRDGQFISLPGGTFEVADVCAGLHYLIAGTMVAVLFSYITYKSNLKKLIFSFVFALSLVLANGVRAFIVMLVASGTNMRYFTGRDHVFFGWVLFGIVVVALFSLGARWSDGGNMVRQQRHEQGEGREFLPLVLVLGLVMMAATAQPLHSVIGSNWLLMLPAGALLLRVVYKRVAPPSHAIGEVDSEVSPYRKAGAIAIVFAAASILAVGPVLSAWGVTAVLSRKTETPLPRDRLSSKASSTNHQALRP